MFMLPVWLEGARTTIAVSPSVALANDIERRCKEAAIECQCQQVGRRERAKLVIVSAESTGSKAFLNYAAGLHLSERLDRIVFDECHLVMTAAGFRDAMHKLKNLGLPVPLILLTATLRPTIVKELVKALAITRPIYIRGCTGRSNFSYAVERCDGEELNARVCEMMAEAMKDLGGDERIVVFCRSVKKCEKLAEMLNCNMYHSRYQGKGAKLPSWMSGDHGGDECIGDGH